MGKRSSFPEKMRSDFEIGLLSGFRVFLKVKQEIKESKNSKPN